MVEKLVGCEGAIQLAFDYHLKAIIHFSWHVLKPLNPIVEGWTSIGCGDELKDEDNMFELEASCEESSQALVIRVIFVQEIIDNPCCMWRSSCLMVQPRTTIS